MNKATAILATIGGILALTGAGCSNSAPETTPNTEENNTTTTSTVETPTTSENTETGEFTVTVTPAGNGVVNVSWTAPSDMPKTDSFRVLHSSRPDVDFNSTTMQPFWFQYMNSTRSTELSNVAKGKRYFKVCQYNLEKKECVRYSNEVEVQVE